MQHCMTVRTNWTKIGDGIQCILLTDLTERLKVMHMNKALTQRAIPFIKVE